MSGLFTTLMAAARGEAEAAVPIPSARFATPLGDDVDWREVEATEHPPQRLDAAETDAADTTLLDHRSTKPETVSVEHASKPAETIAPPQAERPRPIASKPPAASDAVAMPSPDRTEPTPSRPALRTPRGKATAAEAAPQPLGRPTILREADTLLPPVATTITPSSQDHAADTRTTGAEQRRAGGVMLRIGRIELRSAPEKRTPTPLQPATVATSRASTPVRATVRQSLDDYRQRGR